MKPERLQGELVAGPHTRIGLVVSRFNSYVTGHMEAEAVRTFGQLGGDAANLTIASVPGSLELAVAARRMAETGRFDAIVCLGCVIRGQTDHYEHVIQQTAKGIRQVNTQTGVPCIFGVISADTLEQAIDRAGAKKGNQGANAMMAGVEMANLLGKLSGAAVRSSAQARPAAGQPAGRMPPAGTAGDADTPHPAEKD